MTTAGPNPPGTMADATGAGGSVSWGAVDNAKTSNDAFTYASASGTTTSHELRATNFSFAVPDGATINGVTVAIERRQAIGNGNTVKDSVIKLMKAGAVTGSSKADTATTWPNTDTVKSYGGISDVWGATLSVEDVNASTFGVSLIVALNVSDDFEACVARVDFISITVTYTEGGGASAVPVIMRQYRQRTT